MKNDYITLTTTVEIDDNELMEILLQLLFIIMEHYKKSWYSFSGQEANAPGSTSPSEVMS